MSNTALIIIALFVAILVIFALFTARHVFCKKDEKGEPCSESLKNLFSSNFPKP